MAAPGLQEARRIRQASADLSAHIVGDFRASVARGLSQFLEQARFVFTPAFDLQHLELGANAAIG